MERDNNQIIARNRAGIIRRLDLKKLLLSGIAFTILLLILFPLIWMFFSSFKPNPELYSRPPRLFPGAWTFEHYSELFLFTSFPRYFMNTVLVAAVACVVGVVVSLCGVYSVTRFKFIGGRTLTFIMLFVYMLPPILLAVPFFQIWFSLGMVNTLPALMLTYLTITLPFAVWILRPYIDAIPRELEEAGRVDGCTQFQAFVRLIVPQTAPGVAAALIFTFVVVWNEYLYAQVLIRDEFLRTVSLGIASLILETSVYSWGMVNAAGVAATLPVLVLFAFVQRAMVAGLSAGAVKG
jgi:multiple sugar transport system permease protein